jgi:hypothetical protein
MEFPRGSGLSNNHASDLIVGSITDRKETETMSSNKVTPELIENLRNELTTVRKASLHATRMGDFMKVARLTTQAARINKSIMDAESQLLAEL